MVSKNTATLCDKCVEHCEDNQIEECSGFDDSDYVQLCDCLNCEHYDDTDCWEVARTSHNQRAHTLVQCDDIEHALNQEVRDHNQYMREAVASGLTARLL